MNNYKNIIFGFLFLTTLVTGNQSFAQAPYINFLDKTSGTIGETVTIIGSNFSSNAADLSVKFGAAEATITSASSTLLEVKVPAGATFDNVSVTKLSNKLTGYSNELFNISFGGAKNGIASFDAQASFSASFDPYDLCLCDFDKDGLSDVAITNNGVGATKVTVYKNNSNTSTTNFTQVVDSDLTIGFPSINTTCGDLDGDGKADLVVTQGGSNNNGVFVFQNVSTGPGNISFTRIGTNPATADFVLPNDAQGNIRVARRVEINDLDLDGKPEIVITSESGNIVDIFKNTSSSGNISFNTNSVQATIAGLTVSTGMDVKDLNNDGFPEIAVIDDKASNIYIIPNQSEPSSLSFGDSEIVSVNGTFQNIKIGDLNKDGFNDMVVTDRISSKVVVLENKTTQEGGAISLALKTTITSSITQPWGLDLGDLDGDGSIDVAISSTATSGSNIQILLSDDPNNFTFLGTITKPTTTNSRNIKIGDLNGDGKPDLSFTHKLSGAGDLSVFINRNCLIPKITPSEDTEICTGQTLQLKATMGGGATYTWDQDINKDDDFDDPGELNVKTSSDNFIDASANGSGKYRVTVADGLSCSQASNIVDVSVTPSGITAPTISSVPAEGEINCEGDDIQLSASSDASIISYEWSGPNDFSSTTQNPLLSAATPDMTGKYILIGKNADGCISETAEITVIIESLPVIAVNNDGLDTFCVGSTATLSVTDFGSSYTYKWNKDGTDTGQTGTTLSVTESGNYSAIITSVGGCEYESLARTLSAIPVPTNSITSENLVCEDLSISFDAPSSDQNGEPITHSWDFGDGNASIGPSATNTYMDPGTYTVTLTTTYTNILTCSPTVTTKDITVQGVPNTTNGPTISIAGPSTKCPSDVITLSLDGYSNYTWGQINLDDNSISSGISTESSIEASEPIRGNLNGIKFGVQATDDAGCVFVDSTLVTLKSTLGISILTDEITTVNSNGENEIELQEDQLTVDLSVTNATEISWTPEEIFENPLAEMVTAIPNNVNILIKVAGKDSEGCIESDSIRLINRQVRAKRVFSPNGDGIGDECWEITNASTLLDGCTIFIFDSKGQIIKQEPITTQTQTDDCVWDGTRNGLLLPEGIYYFALKCVNNTNVPTDLSGSILLGR